MELRGYQQALVDRVRAAYVHSRRVVAVMPTGAGKTITAAKGVILSAVTMRRRVLTLAHRVELLDQMSEKLDAVGVPHGIIKAGHPRSDLAAPVQVASVSTLARRLDRLAKPDDTGSVVVPAWQRPFDLIVVDECHHTPAATYRRVLAAWPEARVLGLTATPYRLDGSGLDDCYDHMEVGCHVSDLIAGGHLVPCRVFAPPPPAELGEMRVSCGEFMMRDAHSILDKTATTRELVDTWQRLADDRVTVVFATTVAHAEHIAAAYRAAGVPAAAIDGATPAEDRDRVLSLLRSGDLRVVVNVMLLTEGWDLPELGCVQLARPTQSRSLWRQMIGRGMRTCRDKADCLVLDHVGNCVRFGSPNHDDHYALHAPKRDRKAKQSQVIRIVTCPGCRFLLEPGAHACPQCGLVLRRAGPAARSEMELQELSGDDDHDRFRYFCLCLDRCRTPGKAAKQYQLHRGRWPDVWMKVAAGVYTAIHGRAPTPAMKQQAYSTAGRLGLACHGR